MYLFAGYGLVNLWKQNDSKALQTENSKIFVFFFCNLLNSANDLIPSLKKSYVKCSGYSIVEIAQNVAEAGIN